MPGIKPQDRRVRIVFIVVAFLLHPSAKTTAAQGTAQSQSNSQAPTLTVRSNLVLVPALVKNKSGETIFALTAEDFVLTDNGIPQPLQLESDSDSQPIAVVAIVETGGLGASHLRDYRDLGAVLDAVIGDVPHRVAVIGFDSVPRLKQGFTTDTDLAAKTIGSLRRGDRGASILDAINFGINVLRKQPPEYRRAILLFSETADRESRTNLQDAVRAIDDTNTMIYSFGFSSTQAALAHEASKLPRPGGSPYADTPYATGGCMSRDPQADPDADGKRDVQALNCASDLLPPLRIARMAFLSASDGLKRNVPQSVAQLTGGEYFPFKDAKTLREHLIPVSNDVPNYYFLSFRPQSPLPGMHALELTVKGKPDIRLTARKAYWVDAETNAGDKTTF